MSAHAPHSGASEAELVSFLDEVSVALAVPGKVSFVIGMDANVSFTHDQMLAYGGVLGPAFKRGESKFAVSLLEWCACNSAVLASTVFGNQPSEDRWTWEHPSGCSRRQLDYMVVSSCLLSSVMDFMTLHGELPTAAHSDHVPLLLSLGLSFPVVVPRRAKVAMLRKWAVRPEWQQRLREVLAQRSFDNLGMREVFTKIEEMAVQVTKEFGSPPKKEWISVN